MHFIMQTRHHEIPGALDDVYNKLSSNNGNRDNVRNLSYISSVLAIIKFYFLRLETL